MSKKLGRLDFALKGWVPLPQINYDVVFGTSVDELSFTSYTGRYEIGGPASHVTTTSAGRSSPSSRRRRGPTASG